MKIASTVVVAAVLAFESAPAFAHGGMGHMGGMGHNNGMTVNTQTHITRTNGTNLSKTTTKTTKTFFFKRLKFVRIRRKIERLDREIFRLVKLGKGNSGQEIGDAAGPAGQGAACVLRRALSLQPSRNNSPTFLRWGCFRLGVAAR
jgi:hypothetical protein